MVIKNIQHIYTDKIIVRKRFPLFKINMLSKVNEVDKKEDSENNQSHQKNKFQHQEDVKDRFSSLKKTAELLSEKLKKAKSPYHFNIYLNGTDVMLEIIIHGKTGKVILSKKKIITHGDFYSFIRNIMELEGLLFDKKV